MPVKSVIFHQGIINTKINDLNLGLITHTQWLWELNERWENNKVRIHNFLQQILWMNAQSISCICQWSHSETKKIVLLNLFWHCLSVIKPIRWEGNKELINPACFWYLSLQFWNVLLELCHVFNETVGDIKLLLCCFLINVTTATTITQQPVKTHLYTIKVTARKLIVVLNLFNYYRYI